MRFFGGVNGPWQLSRGEDEVTSNSTVRFGKSKTEVRLDDVPQILDLKAHRRGARRHALRGRRADRRLDRVGRIRAR